MRKYINSLMILLLANLFFVPRVYAAECSYSEKAALNKEVANIKVHYEEKEGSFSSEQYGCTENDNEGECIVHYDYLQISILNVSKNFYIEVADSEHGEYFNFDYSEAVDGIITFDWSNVSEVSTLTFRVYASDETKCADEQLRVMYKTMPRRNPYASMDMCAEAPTSYTPCQKFVTSNTDPDFDDFVEGVEEAIAAQKEKEKQEQEGKGFFATIFNFIRENFVAVVVVIAAIAAVATTVIVILRRKHIL